MKASFTDASCSPSRITPSSPRLGYWKPYATSHEELDRDLDVQAEVRNAAWTLLQAVTSKRAGQWTEAGERLQEPRQK